MYVMSIVQVSLQTIQCIISPVTTQLIDVKQYNVLEIHCSCAQWFLHFSLKAGWRGYEDDSATRKDQTKKMYQSSREICLRKSCVRYA
jgi:hypothetical protein